MMDAPIVQDTDGRRIIIGSKVRLWDSLDDKDIGTVETIGDWDVDDDGYGKARVYAPSIFVRFPDGILEGFNTLGIDWGSSDTWPTAECEELTVIEPVCAECGLILREDKGEAFVNDAGRITCNDHYGG